MRFTVYGTPIPKGSTKAFYIPRLKRAVVTHDNPKTKGWGQAVVDAAREALGAGVPMDGPVALVLAFYLPKPKSAPRRVTQPLKKPDLDKLVRCVKDGLTRAGVYHDDAQVVELMGRKEFAAGIVDPEGPRGVPRVEIEVFMQPTHNWVSCGCRDCDDRRKAAPFAEYEGRGDEPCPCCRPVAAAR